MVLRTRYHLRHAHDYETLGVPLGTSKADCQKAYRKLAKKWHPDKHRTAAAAEQEAANDKFVAMSRAWENLNSTDPALKIVPKMFEATWFRWLENIRDWCVSRQLWWGHRIPVYYVHIDWRRFA